jgi:ribosomal 50S subunit-associated protein YjgA (DUF615 family)
MKAGLVIGLGGMGVSVVHRVRTLLAGEPGGKVPEHLRLLAFDVLHSSGSTGRLGQPFYFLVRLPPGEGGSPLTRQAARQVLLADLEKGGPSSLVLRGLALNMEVLRRAGFAQVDVFLVSSSFGVSGSAWLLDMAYLCRHFGQGRLSVNVHAVLMAPESCQTAFPITRAHQLTNFVVLKELESLQKPREWGQGSPIYAGRHIAGMPGLLTAAPFASVQVLDGQPLGGAPEQSVLPAAAECILCQLDEQVGAVLRQTTAAREPSPRGVFSSVGVQSLTHPVRLLVEAGVQRAVLGLIECLLPLRKDPAGGRPLGLEPPQVLITADPTSDVQGWLGGAITSGVLTDIFQQATLGSGPRTEWVELLARREVPQWRATLYQVENAAELVPPGGTPESVTPIIQRHIQAYLNALAGKLDALESDPAGPQEYLQRLEKIFSDYIVDLGRVEEWQKQHSQHSESDDLRQAVEDARREWENRKNSSWARLLPQRVEEAQERYLSAKEAQVAFKQRETLISGVRKTAGLLLALTRKLYKMYAYYARALALAPDSLYNLSLDHLQRIQRELDAEGAIRCQQLVVDENFEERQIQLIFDQVTARVFDAVRESLLRVTIDVDGMGEAVALNAMAADPDALDGQLDLCDLSREPEETAQILSRWFSRALGEQFTAALSENSILNFLNYLNPRPDQLAVKLIERSGPLAKTIVPAYKQVSFLFTPDPNAAERSSFVRGLVHELYQQLGELYQVPTGDPDRVILFRRFDAIVLDNLATFHACVPDRLDPVELKPYVLWTI